MHTEDFNKFGLKGSGGTPKGMKVPDGYFQNLETDILAKVELEKRVSTRTIQSSPTFFTTKFYTQIAVAASLMMGLFVITTNTHTNPVTSEMALVKEVSTNLDYFEIDDYLLAESLTLEDLESVSFADEELTSQDIMEYILDENYSEYTLIDNL